MADESTANETYREGDVDYGDDTPEVRRQCNEIAGLRESYWIDDFDGPVEFQKTGDKWEFGRIFSERQFHNYYIAEASAVCIATQIEGPTPGLKAIAKIRMQIPWKLECPSEMDREKDYTWNEETQLGDYAGIELRNLKKSTLLGSTCTPKLLDYFCERQAKDNYVPNGFIIYMLMEKIPGRNLMNFGELPIEERDQIRIAFALAIREFSLLAFYHEDPHPRNLIWDRKNKRVCIIDMESVFSPADYTPVGHNPDSYKPKEPSFYLEYRSWRLAGAGSHSDDLMDPMVSDMEKMESTQSLLKRGLVALAEGAKGKQPSVRRL